MKLSGVLLSILATLGTGAMQGSNSRSRYDFGSPANLGRIVNSSAFDGGPSIAADRLVLFFTSDRPGGSGGGDLWMTKR